MTDQMVSTLQQSLRGRLISPSDADYDAARALYNGMIDKRPRLIARCVNVADVIAAVICERLLTERAPGKLRPRPGPACRHPRRRSQWSGPWQLQRRTGGRPLDDEERAR